MIICLKTHADNGAQNGLSIITIIMESLDTPYETVNYDRETLCLYGLHGFGANCPK